MCSFGFYCDLSTTPALFLDCIWISSTIDFGCVTGLDQIAFLLDLACLLDTGLRVICFVCPFSKEIIYFPMDPPAKTPRKREPNFTADEKAFLAQLVKKRPIIESKLTDGKIIERKKAAWELLTREFNSNHQVHKRDTIVLKRAWDNLKAVTRKARAAQRGNIIRTGGGPSIPPPSPQQGALITLVEEAAPVMICEIDNELDSDGAVLHNTAMNLTPEVAPTSYYDCTEIMEYSITEEYTPSPNTLEFPVPEPIELVDEDNTESPETTENLTRRKPMDYIRREATMRIKHLENKKKMEMRILKAKLEVQEIKKRTAALEEEKVKLELEEIKKRLNK